MNAFLHLEMTKKNFPGKCLHYRMNLFGFHAHRELLESITFYSLCNPSWGSWFLPPGFKPAQSILICECYFSVPFPSPFVECLFSSALARVHSFVLFSFYPTTSSLSMGPGTTTLFMILKYLSQVPGHTPRGFWG